MYGTLAVLDTLKSTFQSVVEFGEDFAYSQFQILLDAHNRQLEGMYTDLVERTTDRQRIYGSTDQMSLDEVDEFARADAQKVSAGVAVGFPLRLYQVSNQWTRKYFQSVSVAQVTAQVEAAMDADARRLRAEILKALFTPTNYTFNDRLVQRLNQILLNVKALINADGTGMPAGPNGETFNGSTHTHYLASDWTASPSVATQTTAVTNVLETVLEHYADGTPVIVINRAQEAATRGLTGFVPYIYAGQVPAITAVNIPPSGMSQEDVVQLYNRPIGVFNGATVWVKSWMPANYYLVYMRGAAGQYKPVVMRYRDAASGALQLVAQDEKYPLRASTWEREVGFGIWNRTAAACLFVGGSSYVAPTITA